MAGETLCGLGFGICDFLAEDENPHAFLPAFFYMCGSWAMACFAGVLSCRAVGDVLLGMDGLQIGLIVVRMASLAGLRPDGALVSPDITRRQDPPEKNDHG